jgi:hypothetical protein
MFNPLIEGSSDEEEQLPIVRRQRVYRPRLAYEDPSDFRVRFRMTPAQADELLVMLGPRLVTAGRQSTVMSAKDMLLLTLRYYASNGFYYFTGDAQGIVYSRFSYILFVAGYSKDSTWRAVHRVTDAICNIVFPAYVRWPATLEENEQIEYDFYNLHDIGLVGICGAIDGCLIPVQVPGNVERYYVDRHGQHSLNLTAVSDANFRFLYVKANYPGSVSDARVLRNSALAERFERGWRPFEGARLLGDSIYAEKEWLVPMKVHPPEAQRAFYE